MLIGQLLVALGLTSQAEIESALDEQRRVGRRLGEILVARGQVASEDLARVLTSLPTPPQTLDELGIDRNIIWETFLKAAATSLATNTSSLARALCVSNRLANLMIDQARDQQLIEMKVGASMTDLHFILSGKGRAAADTAFLNNSYVGPLPVSLEAYAARVNQQSVRNEIVSPASVSEMFADMVTSEDRLREIGAAANSSRSALLYGPAGNGKTWIAQRMGKLFRSFIFVPYCFEVAGQIIRVYDPSVHMPIHPPEDGEENEQPASSIIAEDYDRRWMPCRRPFVVTGGELTLEMLDLSFSMIAKFYEAPLQVKANNGVFLIDDFGRQLVEPRALLNRWIVPMDRRVDYLKLHTGKSFLLPFDALLLFSSNLVPEDIMDPAFLRRIPHKIFVGGPDEEQFRKIFRAALTRAGESVDEDLIEGTLAGLKQRRVELASFQPAFIVDQIRDLRRYLGNEPIDKRTLVEFALRNMTSK